MPRKRRVLPQQTHHDRLAVQHRNDRDADVHLGVVDADLDAAVLRQALLGDVQVAENLDARNDGRLKALDLRRHRHVLQHAVNAVADAEFVLERFEVNVRGAQLDGVAQHLVDEADDRGVFRRAVEVGVLVAVLVHDLERRLLVQRVDGVRADAEALLHLALDGFAGREHGLEAQARHRLERVQPLGREQPAGGDLDVPVDAAQRKQFLLQQHARGEQREQLLVRLDVLERRVGQVVFLRQPAEHVLLGWTRRGRPRRRAAGQRPGVARGQLPGGNHPVEQLGAARWSFGGGASVSAGHRALERTGSAA